MNNVRGLYPPLYGAAPSGGGGGGGGGQHIQVDTLPEASLANKDKIVQYVGATTETLTNAYFYKCVENTGYDWEETEASETYTEAEELPTASAETLGTIYKVGDKYYQTIIVLTYSWDPVEVMNIPAPTQTGITISETETKIGTYNGADMYAIILPKTKFKSTIIMGSGSSELITSANMPSVEELIDVTIKYTNGSSGYNSKGTVKGSFRITNGSLYWNGGYDPGVSYQYYEDILAILIYTKPTT